MRNRHSTLILFPKYILHLWLALQHLHQNPRLGQCHLSALLLKQVLWNHKSARWIVKRSNSRHCYQNLEKWHVWGPIPFSPLSSLPFSPSPLSSTHRAPFPHSLIPRTALIHGAVQGWHWKSNRTHTDFLEEPWKGAPARWVAREKYREAGQKHRNP